MTLQLLIFVKNDNFFCGAYSLIQEMVSEKRKKKRDWVAKEMTLKPKQQFLLTWPGLMANLDDA